jgi:hypothetical protein
MTLESDIETNSLNISTNAQSINILATSVNTSVFDTNLLNSKTQNINSLLNETTINGTLFIDNLEINNEIQVKAFTDEKHLQIETNKTDIISLQSNKITSLERQKLTHLNIHNASEFYIYSNANRNMFLHTGNGAIHLYANEVRFGNEYANNRFILNGQTQSRAYTEVDYNLLQNINQQLIDNNNNINMYKEFTLNWGIIDRINPFIISSGIQNSSFYYNILSHPELSNYNLNGLWNGGPMRIIIKYSINFRSRKALLKKFISQIRIHDVNNDILIKNSLHQGIEYFNYQDFHDWINYNDEIVCDMINGYDLKLRTQWNFSPSGELGELNSRISIQQI